MVGENETNKSRKREKAKVMVTGRRRGTKVKVRVDYENRKYVKRLDSEWTGTNWYVETYELPEMWRLDIYYLKKGAQELYKDMKKGFTNSTYPKSGIEIVCEYNQMRILNLAYEDRSKVKRMKGAEWDDEIGHWKVPHNVDVDDEVDSSTQVMNSLSHVINIDTEREVLLYTDGDEVKEVPYIIKEDGENTGLVNEAEVLIEDKDFIDKRALDTKRIQEEIKKDICSVDFATVDEMVSQRL